MTPILVGILNVTPDSFSDGARWASVDDAVAAGVAMAGAGAAWIDVGGESTRPGSTPISAEVELERVLPVIRGLSAGLRAAGHAARISIDTYKAASAQAALAAGAQIVNDVSGGLLDPEILKVAAASGATVVLGHLRGRPATMMDDVHFDDVVGEVLGELKQRIRAALAAGCRDIWADPGIGFGKRLRENIALLSALPRVRTELNVPVMVGVSRKRFIGELTGRPVTEREFGTAAAVAAAVLGGADAVRVHDVAAMRDAVQVASALTLPGGRAG